MSDIVEVLTPPNSFSDTATVIVSAGEMRDAAAEITALRAENERLRAALETTTDDCKNAFHENERLRAALEKRACSCLICERSPEDQDDHCEARAALSGADAPAT